MSKSVKVFKKSSPNGKVVLYLGNREYISCEGELEPVTGVVNIQDHRHTLRGQKIFVQLVITFRHGREDEETMGVSFRKEMTLDRVQIYPPPERREEETKLQSRMIQKFGAGTFPFSLRFPPLAPNSVVICADEDKDPANVRIFFHVLFSNNSSQPVHLRGSIFSEIVRVLSSFQNQNMQSKYIQKVSFEC